MCGVSSPAAPNSRERVRNALRAAGLDCAIVETPDSARTAVEAAAAVGAGVGQIVKSLVFLCDDRPVLALVAGDNRLDEARLGGARRRPDHARRRGAGSASTRASRSAASPRSDRSSRCRSSATPTSCEHDYVWAAAGAPHAVFRVEPRALAEAAGAQVAELALREPSAG